MASILNTDNGRVIAATQRPDGSWRKERRVKDGYTPQEEVPLYESRGKQWANTKPAYPPGLDPQLVKAAEAKKKKKKGSGGVQAQQPQRAPLAEFRSPIDTPVLPPEEKWETVDGKGRISKGARKEAVHQHIKNTTVKKDQVEPPTIIQQEPAKKLRNLKKKLKDIETLEARIKSKELKNPDKDQLSKVARKDEIEEAIIALEIEISSLNTAA